MGCIIWFVRRVIDDWKFLKLKSIMNKIFTYLELLWHWRMALIPSLYFNLRYLPFKQGVKMPILINKPHLHKMNGKIVIDAAKITPGMIKLGASGVTCIQIQEYISHNGAEKLFLKADAPLEIIHFLFKERIAVLFLATSFVLRRLLRLFRLKELNLGRMLVSGGIVSLWIQIFIRCMIWKKIHLSGLMVR